MNQLRLSTTVLASVFLAGCMDLLGVDLEKGSLTSGKQQIKLHEWSDGGTIIISPKLFGERQSPYGFYGNDGVNEVAIELQAGSRARLFIATEFIDGKFADITISPSHYSVNDNQQGVLTLASPYRTGSIGYVKSGYILNTFEITLPKELAAFEININGDGIRNPDDVIEDLEEEKYRYVINFRIGVKPYKLDVEFQYERYKKFHIGVPATP